MGRWTIAQVRVEHKLFKTGHGLEQYLTELQPRHSVPLCKFRLSNHKYNKIEF